MTLEQLTIFVAVAEREHLTHAANAIGLTPSAVSASIRTLEGFFGVQLFDRIGRRIELTQAGRTFLGEAKATLARAQAASLVLSELGGLERGVIEIYASQTIATYWLPPRLMAFHQAYPKIDLRLTVGNTAAVARGVLDGTAEIGFIEGHVDEAGLAVKRIADDELVIVVPRGHPLAGARGITPQMLAGEVSWVMREEGSGTRAMFEAALTAMIGWPLELQIALVLPSNEAVLSAVRGGTFATAVSRLAAAPFIETGELAIVNFALPARAFMSLRHKERHHTLAVRELETACTAYPDWQPSPIKPRRPPRRSA